MTAGTLNCDGSLRVEVRQAGQATFMADLARAVEAAQGRAAPVQRLADAVAGAQAEFVAALPPWSASVSVFANDWPTQTD